MKVRRQEDHFAPYRQSERKSPVPAQYAEFLVQEGKSLLCIRPARRAGLYARTV